jgi:hypothetical protein
MERNKDADVKTTTATELIKDENESKLGLARFI